jgi:CoA:oxalate CoA-transferase
MQLDGVRVIDLTRVISGPFCTMLLADLGADVIKIETPEGDPVRQQGAIVNGMSWYFAAFNRNKRSIELDLRAEQGKATLRELLRDADVVIENFRPGVMEQMGLGWDALQEIAPGIIHTSINGFGTTGPYVRRPAFDFITQAMSGFMSMNGTAETGPLRTALPISDLIAGNYAALGTVAALYRRKETGRGEQVCASLLSSMISLGAFVSADYLATGEQMPQTGNDHPLVAPYGLFTASDGDIAVAPSNDAMLRRLLQALGLLHLMDDPRFSSNAQRVTRRAEINALINDVMSKQTREHWIAVINEAGVPCGLVMDLADVYRDPQVRDQEMLLEVEHPGHGAIRMTGFPIKFRNEPCALRHPAPERGGNSGEILEEVASKLAATGE